MILPAKVRRVLLCIASLLSMTLFALLIWRTFLYGRDIQQAGEVSLTLNLPYTPFVYGVALACIPLFLLLLVNFIQTLIKVKKG
jgi:TRAP-type C4-dicarboxylate transport system permease small subunit